MRSGLVGISLRWRLSSVPSAPMMTTRVVERAAAELGVALVDAADDGDAVLRAPPRAAGARSSARQVDRLRAQRARAAARSAPCRCPGAAARSMPGSRERRPPGRRRGGRRRGPPRRPRRTAWSSVAARSRNTGACWTMAMRVMAGLLDGNAREGYAALGSPASTCFPSASGGGAHRRPQCDGCVAELEWS